MDEDAVNGVGHSDERDVGERWRRLKAYGSAVWQTVEGSVCLGFAANVYEINTSSGESG